MKLRGDGGDEKPKARISPPASELSPTNVADEFAFNDRIARDYEASGDPKKKAKADILRKNNARIRDTWKAAGLTDQEFDEKVKAKQAENAAKTRRP